MKLVVISGVSGSGKSTALNVLADHEYYCVDNLPVGLLPDFAAKMLALPGELGDMAAVGIDSRNPASDLGRFPDILEQLKAEGIKCEILYLDADDDVLLKRFSETRRKHPLSREKVPLRDAIYRERELLEPISSRADLYADSSRSNVHQLRDLIRERMLKDDPAAMSILFQSFGYKNGIPTDADFVFDTRFLPNPHWEASLRDFSGLDQAVVDFLEEDEMVAKLFEQIKALIHDWIPCFEADNRSYLSIALGCTGGQHRSVYMADRLGRHFQQHHKNVSIRHRDLS